MEVRSDGRASKSDETSIHKPKAEKITSGKRGGRPSKETKAFVAYGKYQEYLSKSHQQDKDIKDIKGRVNTVGKQQISLKIEGLLNGGFPGSEIE